MCVFCYARGMRDGEYSGHTEAAAISQRVGEENVIRQEFTSGPSYVDALLDGVSLSGTYGQAHNVGYNFNLSYEGGLLFHSTLRTATQSAMQQWSNVANITFTSSSQTSGVIGFSAANLGSDTAGLATYLISGTTIIDPEVQVDVTVTGYSAGGFGYVVLLHELGHVLGLKHPGNYGGGESAPFLSAAEDTYDASLMSYNSGTHATDSRYMTTPMIYDIAAIQYLYGANYSYNSGSSTYSFNGTSNAMTIWDGGGTDVIDASSYSGGTTIDLREGLSNVTSIGEARVWMAFGANIENALGGNSTDTIYGNTLANNLYGRVGSDILYGFANNDVLFGGTGIVDSTDAADTVYGGDGNDQVYGNGGNDVLYGGSSVADPTDIADTVYGGGGADAVYGNGGGDSLFGGGSGYDPNDNGDTVYGGGGSDTVYGNGGNDFLYGGGSVADPNDSADTIYGGFGDDYILGNGGNDFINPGAGNDTVHAGVGDDVYYFENGAGNVHVLLMENAGAAGGDVIMLQSGLNGTGITSTSAALSAVTYSGGNALLNIGTATITIYGVSTLSVDDFSIA